jgi:hypothetical protein
MYELDGDYWLSFGYNSEDAEITETAGEDAALVIGITGLTDLFIAVLIQAINLTKYSDIDNTGFMITTWWFATIFYEIIWTA